MRDATVVVAPPWIEHGSQCSLAGHARLVEQVLDSDLNLSFNLGLDVEAKPDEQLEVVTEGYLHTKFVQLEEGHAISNKTVGRSRQPRESERARTHAR